MSRPGTGKYDEWCRRLLKETHGQAAVVVVINGRGSTSLSSIEDFSLDGSEYYISKLPDLLRRIAKQIESE